MVNLENDNLIEKYIGTGICKTCNRLSRKEYNLNDNQVDYFFFCSYYDFAIDPMLICECNGHRYRPGS